MGHCGREVLPHRDGVGGRPRHREPAAAVSRVVNQAPDEPQRQREEEQVEHRLLERIRSGAWKPGQLIPNEFEIAAEFGVSQGTARKAINELASEGLVVRQQGRGTFVVERTPAHELFRFFNLFDASGAAVIPDSRNTHRAGGIADETERHALALPTGARVVRITRIRTHHGVPFITESIASAVPTPSINANTASLIIGMRMRLAMKPG